MSECARCGEPYENVHYVLDITEGRTTRTVILCLTLIELAPQWDPTRDLTGELESVPD